MLASLHRALSLSLLLAGCGPRGESPGDSPGVPDTGSPFDHQLVITPAAGNDLVFTATWLTPTPATSVVEVGQDGVWSGRIGDAAHVTEHAVTVVGLHADSTYQLRVVSTAQDGETWTSPTLSVTTGALPYDWIAATLDVYEPSLTQPGWTLSNVVTSLQTQLVVVIFDELAQPVWYHDMGHGFADIQASFTDQGTVLIGPGVSDGSPIVEVDLTGEVVWEGPLREAVGIHHVLQKLDDGDYITTRNETDDEGARTDVLWQFDADLETTWEWHFAEHVDLEMQEGGSAELTHVNSLDVDPELDEVCVHPKYLNAVLRIDRATGDILWWLGDGRDFTADPDAEEPWFSAAHGVKCPDADRVLLYDNGTVTRGWSRAVEYRLDHDAKSAEITWQYPQQQSDDDFWSSGWGDVDRLDNGNTLITYGERPSSEPEQVTRIFEVTPDGQVAWQLSWGAGEGVASAFKAERMPALMEAIE